MIGANANLAMEEVSASVLGKMEDASGAAGKRTYFCHHSISAVQRGSRSRRKTDFNWGNDGVFRNIQSSAQMVRFSLTWFG